MKAKILCFNFAVRAGLLSIILMLSACTRLPHSPSGQEAGQEAAQEMPFSSPSAQDPREWGRYEADYMRTWCRDPEWRMEPTLFNRDEPDCLTGTHAVEFDWAYKWKECIEQALRYADTTGLKPMCVLILKKPSDIKYLDRLKKKIETDHTPLEIQTMTPEDL